MSGVTLIAVGVRLAAVYCGAWTGCVVTGVSADHRRVFWMSMITQSGVAMGLARVAGTKFPDWGPHFQTLMIAIVVVNLMIGPPCFRHALIQVGEARSLAAPPLLLGGGGGGVSPKGSSGGADMDGDADDPLGRNDVERAKSAL